MYLLINKFDLIKIIIKCRFMGRKGRHKDKDTWQHTEKSNYALYRFAIIFRRSFLCRIFFFRFSSRILKLKIMFPIHLGT